MTAAKPVHQKNTPNTSTECNILSGFKSIQTADTGTSCEPNGTSLAYLKLERHYHHKKCETFFIKKHNNKQKRTPYKP